MAKGEKGVNRVVIGSFIMCFVTVVNRGLVRSADELVLSHCMEVKMEVAFSLGLIVSLPQVTEYSGTP